MKASLRILAASLVAVSTTSHATVYFENTGTKTGWSNYPQDPQQIGRIYDTTSPRWGSSGTAIAFEQTWNGVLTGYHSEVVQHNCQANGQDRYYGQVWRLPSNHVFHNKNITWQQFSPENPSGPWRLVFLQGTDFRTQTVNGIQVFQTGVAANRWYRIVTRLKLASSGGAYEVWVDGTKKLSQLNLNQTVPGTWIRWSVGMYCTAWRTQVPPANERQFTIYQDQFRIASSYSEAEPANWGTSTGVTFYSSVNYSGTASQVLAKGTYTLSQLAALGVANDSASSVRIPSGWTVTIYQHDNFGGTSWVRTSDTPNFTDISGLNDAMSSCRIE